MHSFFYFVRTVFPLYLFICFDKEDHTGLVTWSQNYITKLQSLNHISVERGLAEVKVSVELLMVEGAMQVARSQGKPHRKTTQSSRAKRMELMKAAFLTRDIGASSSLSKASASLAASLPASLSSLATSVYSPILAQD